MMIAAAGDMTRRPHSAPGGAVAVCGLLRCLSVCPSIIVPRCPPLGRRLCRPGPDGRCLRALLDWPATSASPAGDDGG